MLVGRLVPEAAGMEVIVSALLSGHSEQHTPVRTNYVLGVFIRAADIAQITAAADSLHNREHLHHNLRAYAVALFVDRTAVGAGVFVANLLAVAAVILGLAATQIAYDLDSPLILFIKPFLHFFGLLTAIPIAIIWEAEWLYSFLYLYTL